MTKQTPFQPFESGNVPAQKPPPEDSEGKRTQRFWMGLFYAALAGFGAVSVAITGYAGLTWDRPNRGWFVGLVVFGLALAFGAYWLRHYLVNCRYRVWLFGSWNTAAFLFVVLLCSLDGGINSPMLFLYILPMLYLGIGYPLQVVLLSGLMGLAGYLSLVVFNTGTVYGPTQLLQLMALVIGWLLAIIGAINRDRQDQALERLRRQLETLASIDELTGCLNRRAFTSAMHQEVARAARYRHDLALLIIDVDHFKQVNDCHGHLMGDSVLQEVGLVLRQTARHADRPGRPGGDEFALLAPEADCVAARALAERLQKRMKAYSLPTEITLSIGVCAMSPDIEDVTTLYRRADRALYEAKCRGRDQVVSCDEFDPEQPDKDDEQVA